MKKLSETMTVDYRVSGYRNLWSIVDKAHGYVLLENNTYGDETCYLVVPEDAPVDVFEDGRPPMIMGEIYETFDSLEDCLIDEGVL